MRLALTALAIAGLSATAALAGVPSAGTTSQGSALVDAKGMTLYTFDRDAAGKSNCTGQCAQNWPPLAAPVNAQASGDWTVVARDDGSKQWAYKGKPLYTWVKDAKPGDVTGDGVTTSGASPSRNEHGRTLLLASSFEGAGCASGASS
jgi:predicted lipoprotein with Yx(FWY)xxD motif